MARKYLLEKELQEEMEKNIAMFSVEPSSLNWLNNFQPSTNLEFIGNEVIQGILSQNSDVTPMEIFFSIIDNDIIELMVMETNRYASQIMQSQAITRGHRMNRWKNTDMDEMKMFLAVLLFMGLFNFPKIE